VTAIASRPALGAVAAPSLALARRTLRGAMRRPQFLAPLVIMPTLFLAINTGGLHRSTDLPGFPHVDGFLDFQLAGAITQSLLLGGVMQGIGTALEIEGGFFDRLVASPIPRVAIVFGRILADTAIAAAQVLWFLALGLIFGVTIHGGVPGALLVLLIGALAGTGFAALGVLIALLARNASTVQGIFPLVFVVLFVSSAFFPRGLLSHPADWAADYNPLSYVADGMRDPVISSVSATPVLEGLAAALLLVAGFVGLAVLALRGRLRDA
jgi:ABC-2 type transport system permease protein